MDEWVKLFRELGFPAAVAVYVLWRVDASIRELTRAVYELRTAMLERRHPLRPQDPPDAGSD